MTFRYDINALRALAVLAVVLFHFGVPMPGGFAGVDVFFVISGYLMSAIILTALSRGNFSLWAFYQARANRIIPVLAVACLLLLVLAWFFLLPSDYKNLARHAEKSLLFVSNHTYAKNLGYFDTGSHSSWLLHTWSLSVEWQFYLLYPLVLLTIYKLTPKAEKYAKYLILLLFLASFAYAIFETHHHPNRAYYLLATRAWELLFGALAFVFPWRLTNDTQRLALQHLGLALIISSYFLVSEQTPWPSFWAAWPTFGAYLLIVAAHQHHPLLRTPIVQWLGQASYSIYIWHWPVVLFGLYFAIDNWAIFGIVLSLLLGFASYFFIERRRPTILVAAQDFYKMPVLSLLFVALLASVVARKANNDFMATPLLKQLHQDKQLTEHYICSSDACTIEAAPKIGAIIVGDSHANAITTAVQAAFQQHQLGLVSLAREACPLSLDILQFSDHLSECAQINQDRLKQMTQAYAGTPIVIAQRYALYFVGENDPERPNFNTPNVYAQGARKIPESQLLSRFAADLSQTLCHLSANHPVYIVQPIPEMGFNVLKRAMKNERWQLTLPMSIAHSDYLQRSHNIRQIIEQSAQRCGAKVLDPAEFLCKNGRCIAEHQGLPIYHDGDHLNAHGTTLLSPMFAPLQP